MALEDILETIKKEYQDSVNSYNTTKADLQKLETIKATSNYANKIAKLNLKLLAFVDPFAFKKEEFKFIFEKKPLAILLQLLIILSLISTSLVMGGFVGITLATFLSFL